MQQSAIPNFAPDTVLTHRLTYAQAYSSMRCGNQVAIAGMATRMARRMRSVTTNGSTPTKIVDMLTSLMTLLMTNTFMPTGGWIRPSSTVITMMIPNQIGSKPSAVTTGNTIGTVRITIAMASMRQPSTRYINRISASTP